MRRVEVGDKPRLYDWNARECAITSTALVHNNDNVNAGKGIKLRVKPPKS